MCVVDHVDAGSPMAGESEASVLDDGREHWSDADEGDDGETDDESWTAMEWADRSRWIRHVILWKQEHDALRTRQRGKTDRPSRLRDRQQHSNNSAVRTESETSQTSASDDRRDDSVRSSHGDDTLTAHEQKETAAAQSKAAPVAGDRPQQAPQQLEEERPARASSAVLTIRSDERIRPSDSLSLPASDGTAQQPRQAHALPSGILKHVLALKKNNAEAGSSLSLSSEQAESQHERHVAIGAPGERGSGSEQSAASPADTQLSSFAPARHVRSSSKADGLESERASLGDKDASSGRASGAKSFRHRAQRSLTAMRSASGKWPLPDGGGGGKSTPAFALIASMGRSLLRTSRQDSQGGEEAFDIDAHTHSSLHAPSRSQTGMHSARRGDAVSRTGSASIATSSGTSAASTRASLSPGQLKADLLASGLIRDRTHVFTVYPSSVPASELIDWLVSNAHADDRAHACLVSATLLLVGLRSFHASQHDASDFADDGRLYTFEAAAVTKGALRMALERPRDRSVSTKQALAALVQRAAASAGKRAEAPAAVLASHVQRARLQSVAQPHSKAHSSHAESDPAALPLSTLREVRVDVGRHEGGGAAHIQQQQQQQQRPVSVDGRLHTPGAAVVSNAAEALSTGGSPPTQTRLVFLRERKPSSRWQAAAQAGQLDSPHSATAEASRMERSQQQHSHTEAPSRAADPRGQGPVFSPAGQSPLGAARSVRSPSAHKRSSTTAFTPHRLLTTGSGGGRPAAAARSREVDALSLTQEALFALGVADLSLVDTQLAEQKQRDERYSRAAQQPPHALPGAVSASGDSHRSVDLHSSPLDRARTQSPSPTLPPGGVLGEARGGSVSHCDSDVAQFSDSAAESPDARDGPQAARRVNSLRSILHRGATS